MIPVQAGLYGGEKLAYFPEKVYSFFCVFAYGFPVLRGLFSLKTGLCKGVPADEDGRFFEVQAAGAEDFHADLL